MCWFFLKSEPHKKQHQVVKRQYSVRSNFLGIGTEVRSKSRIYKTAERCVLEEVIKYHMVCSKHVELANMTFIDVLFKVHFIFRPLAERVDGWWWVSSSGRCCIVDWSMFKNEPVESVPLVRFYGLSLCDVERFRFLMMRNFLQILLTSNFQVFFIEYGCFKTTYESPDGNLFPDA